MKKSTDLAQLRALLAEKFPHAHTAPRDSAGDASELPKGALTEVVAKKNSASAAWLRTLISRAAHEKQIIALIDGNDSFDATQIEESVLTRLLWVRCRSASEAMKAADLVLRDSNFTLVVLDLKLNPENQLRKIPATSWYRLQRLVEKTSAACVILVPQTMANAARRLELPVAHKNLSEL